MQIYANLRENDRVDIFWRQMKRIRYSETIRKNKVKKAQAKVVNCAKNKYCVPIGPPLGHLSVEKPFPF